MFICNQCQASSLKWTGKCPTCGAWNSLEESKTELRKWKKLQIGKVVSGEGIIWHNTEPTKKIQSASGELDLVLGGWLSEGSLVLLSGEPGIGKSTLSLQMSQWYAEQGESVLYVSWEEHIGQIRSRAIRLGVHHENIRLVTESDFDSILSTIEQSSAGLVIIDSLSVLSSPSIEGSPGSISQIRVMTEMCMQVAKKLRKSIILIGHVTKDGSISWPKSLEHLVDVVLFLEGVRTENYRLLRAFKNRFGSTDNVGLFRMEEHGLIDLPNPGMEFIDPSSANLPWSALTLTVEWNRPILIEIEALTTYTKFWYPKRSSRGIPSGKLDLLIAVMSKFTQSKLENSDVYLNVSRGLSLTEPGVDLAAIAALISSKKNMSLGRSIFLGEVSLTWVVKNVYLLEKRLYEARKLGFELAYIPSQYAGNIPDNLKVVRIANVADLKI
jgi:DNA repair protein RadA/Sms